MKLCVFRYLCVAVALSGHVACHGRLGAMSDGEAFGNASSEGGGRKGGVVASGSRHRSTYLSYDAAGRPVSVRHVIEGASYLYQFEFGYSGGARSGSELGNVQTAMVFPDNERVESRFDVAGGVQETSAVMPSASPLRSRPSGHVYKDVISKRTKWNHLGQVEWTELGDNTRTLRTYNSARQLVFTVTKKMVAPGVEGETLQAFGYSYDLLGRVIEVRDFCAETPSGIQCCDPRDASCSHGPLSARYEYDVAGGLKSMSSHHVEKQYNVDAIGNLIFKEGAVQKYGETGLPHALTSVVNEQGLQVGQYAYNAVGSMTFMIEDGVVTEFSWNVAHMPVKTVRGQDVTERFYLGESLYKRRDTVAGKTSVTYFLPGLRIEDGTYRKFYGAVAEREAVPSAHGSGVKTRGTLRFYHPDHLGSSTLVTDEHGNPISRAAYFPFGDVRMRDGSFTPKKQFTQQEKEVVSGLYDYNARLYNARTGRFISADTVMDGLNPYSYVHNNPINLVDPSGHVACNRDKNGKCTTSADPELKPEDSSFFNTIHTVAEVGGSAIHSIGEFVRGVLHGMATPDRADLATARAAALYSGMGAQVLDFQKDYARWHGSTIKNGSNTFKAGAYLSPLVLAGTTVAVTAGSERASHYAYNRGAFVLERAYYNFRHGPMFTSDGFVRRPAVNSREATLHLIVEKGWTRETQFYRSMDPEFAPVDGVQHAVPAGQAVARVTNFTQVTERHLPKPEGGIFILRNFESILAKNLNVPTLNVTIYGNNGYNFGSRVQASYTLDDIMKQRGNIYLDSGAAVQGAYLLTVPQGRVRAAMFGN